MTKKTEIRPLREEDIPAIQGLYQTCFNEPSPPKSHFMLAYDPGPGPSLVSELNGEITAFIGATRHEFEFEGRRLMAVVTSKYMVHPGERHSLLALKLVKTLLLGPQDFTYCDLVNESARRVLKAIGAEISWLNSMNWHYSNSRADQWRATVKRWLKGGREAKPRLTAETMQPDDLLMFMERYPDSHKIKALYSTTSLRRAVALLNENHPNGVVRLAVVRDDQLQERGWFAYHTNWYNQVLVLGMGAEPGCRRELFECVLRETSRFGRVVSSWLQPDLLPVHSELSGVDIRPRKYWTLVYSRDKSLMAELVRGNASINPLNGECLTTRA